MSGEKDLSTQFATKQPVLLDASYFLFIGTGIVQ